MSVGFTTPGVSFLAFALLTAFNSRVGAQSVCRTPDWLSAHITEEVTRYVTATSGDNAVVRDSLRLPTASAKEVRLVATDNSLCAVAAAAYALDRQGIGAGLSGRVFVVKVKTVYVVYDPEFNNYPVAGHPHASVRIVFDSNWQPLARY